MNSPHDAVNITIDNRPLTASGPATILEVARDAGIYIPTLCAHPDLTPYGGCRLCIVEVEGMRGFPTACTTPVTNGMIVRTHTAQVHEIRSEILRLILSEHPCSCLICDEQEECQQYSPTVRKAGVTTGCRYCPNDHQCELQDVVRSLGITEVGYPVYYRNFQVKKDDPFFDRDYNLCILCGRCVRMCQEIRAAGTLTFVRRGPDTVVGPAFDRSHFAAGCEFCGACVSVCPTGALSEKTRKWKGPADREVITTCPFCGVGCQMRLQVKGKEVIGSLPLDDGLVNRGQLCVKGRFCVPETVSHPRRLDRAYKLRDGVLVDIGWTEAVDLAAEALASCPPDQFGMLVSPNCSNEDLYIAQKFARLVIGSNNIDTSARHTLGRSYHAFLGFLRKPATLEDVRRSDVIVSIGLDTRFGRSVVGAELRRAHQRGAKIITIHPRRHDLAQIATHWLQPPVGGEHDLLTRLMTGAPLTSRDKSSAGEAALIEAAALIARAERITILLGGEILFHPTDPELLQTIHEWALSLYAGVMPLPSHNNLLGSILMGATTDTLPGGLRSDNPRRRAELAEAWGRPLPEPTPDWHRGDIAPTSQLKVLYLVGEGVPSMRPPAEYVIYQNIFTPPRIGDATLILPAAAFSEIDGTVINGEGRVQRLHRAVDPPGDARPDWEILCKIAQKMGSPGFDFVSAREVNAEIASLIDGFGDFENPTRETHHWTIDLPDTRTESTAADSSKASADYPFDLATSPLEHTYRGYALSERIAGLRRLYPIGVVEMNPDDARNIGVATGDKVAVSAPSFDRLWPVSISPNQPPGSLHIILPPGETNGSDPHRVQVRKNHV